MNIRPKITVKAGLTDIEVNFLKFSGGEIQVMIQDLSFHYANSMSITAHLHSSDDIMALLVLTDAIRNIRPDMPISLIMPYIPYARQDRVCSMGESLSIKVFCSLINSQNYTEVEVWDPHSPVASALLDRCCIIPQHELVRGLLNLGGKRDFSNTVLVSPDAGANKKVLDAARALGFSQVVRADKTRDVKTGSITGTVVYSENVGDKNFLILDDISDKGGTFVHLAKALRPLTTGKIMLYVTHSIMPDGLGVFKGVIDEFYTANPFDNKYKPFTNLLEEVDGS